jgi:hypothetical protein
VKRNGTSKYPACMCDPKRFSKGIPLTPTDDYFILECGNLLPPSMGIGLIGCATPPRGKKNRR